MTPEIPTIYNGYQYAKDSLMTIIEQIGCAHCGRIDGLRACMGCCNVFYCNKRCKKIHWIPYHRKQCDGKFNLLLKFISSDDTKKTERKTYWKKLRAKFPNQIRKHFYLMRDNMMLIMNDKHC